MTTALLSAPIILSFSGHDPSGGAGIQADIETAMSFGCHCSPVITALTVQDSSDIKHFSPTSHTMLIDQATTVLKDYEVDAIKIGMVGSIENIEAIHYILEEHPNIPVILDPVLAAGGGKKVTNHGMVEALRNLILPHTLICTPNTIEAMALAPEADCLTSCAHELLTCGAEYVLVTGGHADSREVINTLWGHFRELSSSSWERLPHEYHGSGCTLASAIAAQIAHGIEPEAAIRDAQSYTWNALKNARNLGQGQRIPNRLFWTTEDKKEQSWHQVN